jgi:hypothetical protein
MEKSSKVMRFGFIIGTGRCGTTLLAKMLNAHSEMCIPHELQILMEERGNGKRLMEVFQSGEHASFVAKDYIRLIEELCPYRIREYFDLEEFFQGRTYPETDLCQLATDLFTAIACSKGKSYLLEQTPWYGQHIPTLTKLFPGAKFIHVIRDGRDVAISFARTPWWSKDVLANLSRWEQEVSVILRDTSLYLRTDQVHLVRYEDLVLSPEKTIKEICPFLEINYESEMLDSSKYFRYESLLKENPKVYSSQELQQWESSSKTPTFSGSIKAWSRQNTVDFGMTTRNVNALLGKLGYEVPEPIQ